jgi:antitoxin component YwqK of YwqJK toxin-antitoxin module
MIKYLLLIGCFLTGATCLGQRYYYKSYSADKMLLAEGWMYNGNREDYWKCYHANGKLKEAGHYKSGQRNNYWYFYDENGTLQREGHYNLGKREKWWKFYENDQQYHVVEYKNDLKNGFCIFYRSKTPYKCEKYENGLKTKEWTDMKRFKRDNRGYFFL